MKEYGRNTKVWPPSHGQTDDDSSMHHKPWVGFRYRSNRYVHSSGIYIACFLETQFYFQSQSLCTLFTKHVFSDYLVKSIAASIWKKHVFRYYSLIGFTSLPFTSDEFRNLLKLQSDIPVKYIALSLPLSKLLSSLGKNVYYLKQLKHKIENGVRFFCAAPSIRYLGFFNDPESNEVSENKIRKQSSS
jgi:hypothetical protein